MKGFYCLVIMLTFLSTSMAQDLQRGWAWSGMAYTTLGRQAVPTPSPTPKPGDPCKACLGTGKVGDGRVWQTCRDCDGTGKVIGAPVSSIQQSASDVLLSPAPSPSDRPQPAKSQPVVVSSSIMVSSPPVLSDCPGGVCKVPSAKPTQYAPPPTSTTRRGWIFRR